MRNSNRNSGLLFISDFSRFLFLSLPTPGAETKLSNDYDIHSSRPIFQLRVSIRYYIMTVQCIKFDNKVQYIIRQAGKKQA